MLYSYYIGVTLESRAAMMKAENFYKEDIRRIKTMEESGEDNYIILESVAEAVGDFIDKVINTIKEAYEKVKTAISNLFIKKRIEASIKEFNKRIATNPDEIKKNWIGKKCKLIDHVLIQKELAKDIAKLNAMIISVHKKKFGSKEEADREYEKIIEFQNNLIKKYGGDEVSDFIKEYDVNSVVSKILKDYDSGNKSFNEIEKDIEEALRNVSPKSSNKPDPNRTEKMSGLPDNVKANAEYATYSNDKKIAVGMQKLSSSMNKFMHKWGLHLLGAFTLLGIGYVNRKKIGTAVRDTIEDLEARRRAKNSTLTKVAKDKKERHERLQRAHDARVKEDNMRAEREQRKAEREARIKEKQKVYQREELKKYSY